MTPLLLLLLLTISTIFANEFDTYNADCPRVRRNWYSLSKEEKDLYIEGLMKIREKGGGKLLEDELVAIGSVHEDDYGSIVHKASSFFFWHSYLTWELESRIRNLGGKWKCFAIPYWDFSTEASRGNDLAPLIFNNDENGLGGYGDPHNQWTVNEFSWKYSTKDYWVPAHCTAEGDEFPICSLKRATSDKPEITAEEFGQGIIDHPTFTDFTRWYVANNNLPGELLTSANLLLDPVITSYDPIWYLFHSMVTYHQYIWEDCNDYDQIDADDLDDHPEAYSAFCDNRGGNIECYDMHLDAKQYIGGYLKNDKWAWIYSNDLTVRNSYHMDRWNIKYDLETGGGFFKKSGLDKYCKNKLNPDWFILAKDPNADEKFQEDLDIEDEGKQQEQEEEEEKILMDSSSSTTLSITNIIQNNQLLVSFIIVGVIISFLFWRTCMKNNKQSVLMGDNYGYGSV